MSNSEGMNDRILIEVHKIYPKGVHETMQKLFPNWLACPFCGVKLK